ncbi:MAG: 4-(cytidine 5'-diphospho)-2-C-methyl-D-erythritol kinase [Nitratireductor sp.]|nr:4-(cytidine 5'-diphospho)-2-C-methyl-D-erythritol kinase [Nitratireductor sp.]
MVTCKAPAKINLALHVSGQRADGYHLIDTQVGFCALGDSLTAERSDTGQFSIEITGPFSGAMTQVHNGDNLVMRAAHRLETDLARAGHATFPVRFRLEKNLPLASGMGGGSADAAAALLALARLWHLPEEFDLEAIAAQLGADVPMCLHSRPLRAGGVGEQISLLADQPPLDIVLANPGISVATPDVFRALRDRNNSGLGAMPHLVHDVAWLAGLRNDLQPAALSLAPAIGSVLEALAAMPGAKLVRMSGSGATCFAIHENAGTAQDAASRLVDSHRDWWCAATRIEGRAISGRLKG